jgi:ribosome-binding factor A
MKDNRIGMVTVTGVEVSKDIRYARVYATVLGNNEIIKSSLETLNNASSFIRMSLGTKIILKHLPELTFHYDSSMAEGMRIDKLIEQIKINFDGD